MRMLQCQLPAHAGVMYPEGSTCPWCPGPTPVAPTPDPPPWFMIDGWESCLTPDQPDVRMMEGVAEWYRHHGYPDCEYVLASHKIPAVRIINGTRWQCEHSAQFRVSRCAAQVFIGTAESELTDLDPIRVAFVNRFILHDLLRSFPSPAG